MSMYKFQNRAWSFSFLHVSILSIFIFITSCIYLLTPTFFRQLVNVAEDEDEDEDEKEEEEEEE